MPLLFCSVNTNLFSLESNLTTEVYYSVLCCVLLLISCSFSSYCLFRFVLFLLLHYGWLSFICDHGIRTIIRDIMIVLNQFCQYKGRQIFGTWENVERLLWVVHKLGHLWGRLLIAHKVSAMVSPSTGSHRTRK